VRALRSLWQQDGEPFVGRFYSTASIELRPRPTRPSGPPIWIGSWGSDAGLRRTARVADGWLASAYNTTPAAFAGAWRTLPGLLSDEGWDAATFPNALAHDVVPHHRGSGGRPSEFCATGSCRRSTTP
jgi:hypothetical protein